MKTAGNIIWLVLAGIWLFIAYVFAGILSCIFIITIPSGITGETASAAVEAPSHK